MSKNVGQGILDQMTNNQDVPWHDSDFGTNGDGSKWEKGYGFKGIYVAGELNPGSGDWQESGPFPYAA